MKPDDPHRLTSKELMKAIRDENQSQIDTRMIAKKMMAELGGEEMYAIEVVKTYRNAPENSPLRVRMIELMGKIFETEASKPRKQTTLDELSKDDLMELLDEYVRPQPAKDHAEKEAGKT